MSFFNNDKWYGAGLAFECTGCGRCCSGPEEGYIWITKPEIEKLAEFLGITVTQVRDKYLKRVGAKLTIIEDEATKDCIFLQKTGNGKKGCSIYPVRPNQCRTWPFWNSNLKTIDDWNIAGIRCPGINKGKLFSLKEIETRRKQKTWLK